MSLIERCNGQSAFGNACNNIANAKNLFSSLAELLQRPQRRNRSLQNSCKCPKGEIGACRTSANVQKEKSELVELLQMSKRRNRSLQNFCKCPKGENGVCRNAASISRDVLANRETSVEPLCWLCSYVELTLTRSCFEFIE